MEVVEGDDSLEPHELFTLLYENHPTELCRAKSREVRDSNFSKASSLVYSEIDFHSFMDMMEMVKDSGLLPAGGEFADLGCGSGKPVFAAALSHNFEKCLGVEILPGLYEYCLELMTLWNDDFWDSLPPDRRDCEVDFVNQDLILAEWFEANCIFVNCTLFDQKLINQIGELVLDSPEDSVVISTTYRIPNTMLVTKTVLKHSWGDSICYIQKRCDDDD